ncbi:hypothetical protein M407DRAFT_18805 [Tulasnella calospora MUT 4182]|uniref:Uncharacterized protein n=1 Tax=Tulasnella calospora MUT 4182 TaxID=1051891 RepID=A0A0C3QT17_9AGAM|nr:hypothetical protein M407DRAFT_18805 [Tulasnella calospora MUT 4182]
MSSLWGMNVPPHFECSRLPGFQVQVALWNATWQIETPSGAAEGLTDGQGQEKA